MKNSMIPQIVRKDFFRTVFLLMVLSMFSSTAEARLISFEEPGDELVSAPPTNNLKLTLTEFRKEGTVLHVTFVNRTNRRATFDFGFIISDATVKDADKVTILDTKRFAPNQSYSFSLDVSLMKEFKGSYKIKPCYRIKGGSIVILNRSCDVSIGEKKRTTSRSSSTSGSTDNVVRDVAEVMPQYPGGMDALKAFFDRNIRYPAEAKRKGQEGMVILQFVVEKNGSLSNIKVLSGKHQSLNNEALRVCKMVSGFRPGRENNQPVRVKFTYPYRFVLP